eukprot:NODE_356_length_1591_cov_181.828145_g267_i0.p1 GENE.NODE_356_length_1591_cov_181.828145_g267_i0~~NODE_356_length_1591_cov_181.828145_g267_i0.p1  ORF type:complete len:420 (+),score=97.11 NODE_356_length_1591_cov_181.828145_g267_i0:33-1292(+)
MGAYTCSCSSGYLPPTCTTTFQCPSDQTWTVTSPSTGMMITYGNPVVPSGYTITRTSGFASGTTFPVGVTPITFDVSDSNGDRGSCTMMVTLTQTTGTVSSSGCGTNICPSGQTCTPVSYYPYYTCAYTYSYTSYSTYSYVGYNPCNYNPCGYGTVCVSTSAFAAGYRCLPSSYTSSPYTYSNNPCASVACGYGTYCVPNTASYLGYTCSAAPSGYTYGPTIQTYSTNPYSTFSVNAFVPAASSYAGVNPYNILYLGGYSGSTVVQFRFVSNSSNSTEGPADEEDAGQVTDRFIQKLRDDKQSQNPSEFVKAFGILAAVVRDDLDGAVSPILGGMTPLGVAGIALGTAVAVVLAVAAVLAVVVWRSRRQPSPRDVEYTPLAERSPKSTASPYSSPASSPRSDRPVRPLPDAGVIDYADA